MTATLVVIFAISFGICLILTPLVRALAVWIGLVDHPDGRRKIHAKAIPVAGGLSILASVAATIAGAWLVQNPLQEPLAERQDFLVGLGLASLLICGTGLL